MKIVFFEVESWEEELLRRFGEEHQVVLTGRPLRPGTVGEHADAEVISPFVHSKITLEVLEEMPRLRLIATRSTGYDHIDVAACARRGVTVCNVPGYGDRTVAEHVFALLLALSRHIPEAVNRTRRGDFSQQGLQGFELYGKTLGLIGTGRIGRHVAEIARGFGMRVVAYDVRPDPRWAEAHGVQYVPLDQLYAQSDVISLHVPATPQTENMINREAFARMKPGVVLINTARGSLVDIEALLEAIAQGKVAGAGLDVLPEEAAIAEEAELLHLGYRERHELEVLLAGHILLRLRNVIITPHSAFNTREAVARLLETTIENIRAFLTGSPQNVVSPS